MKKPNKKILSKILAGLSSFIISFFYIFKFGVVVYAVSDTIADTATDIINLTRYYWGDITDIEALINTLDNIGAGGISEYMYNQVNSIMDNTATNSALSINRALIDYANASTSGGSPSVTIQDSWTCVGKRQIVYPYDNMVETDYIYVYVDNNQSLYSPQQFGNFGIAPNTILLIRDTNWEGVKAYSIPIALNRITFYPSQLSHGIAFQMLGTSNNTFVYESPNGTQTVGYRFENYTGSNPMRIVNNSNNTIRRTNLIDVYNSDYIWYNYFISDHAPLSVLQCFLGTGYNYSMNRFMGDFPAWAFSCGYVNSPTLSASTFISSGCNTNINNNNNPISPPVYVVPSSDPWASGKTIDNSTINNYNDYGLTINNDNFELDVNALGAALGAAITPTFQGLLDATFSSQPDIGVSFSAGENTINYIDLLHDLLGDIVVYPSGDVWQPPSYPAITTYGISINPQYPATTYTTPDYLPTVASDMYSIADRLLGSEILPIFLGLALFGLAVGILM